MPASIGHVYNSNDKGTDIRVGNGWRLNISQRVISKTIGGEAGYEYTDEDGTRHFLKYNSTEGKYFDESGLNISMTINSSSTAERFILSDKSENLLKFTQSGYLYTIMDNNGNYIRINYSGTAAIKVTDGAKRVMNLTYSGDKLSEISDPAGRKTKYYYTGDNLTKIVYPDGKESNYTYDGNNNLTSAKNFDGYEINYEYYTVSPYKVKKITEKGNGTLGNDLSLTYGYNTTTFTDNENKNNIYQFNDYGNTISIRDDYGNALYYDYETDGNKTNKLALSSKLQKPVMNYLQNHNAETNDAWVESSWLDSTGSASFDSGIKYIGNQSLKVNKTNTIRRHFMHQSLSLEKGKEYTLSAYIKTDGISNTKGKGAALTLSYQDGAGKRIYVDSEYVSGTKDWDRYEVTIELPADAVSDRVYVRPSIIEETGTAYFDALQLEDGSLPNRYNLLENANLTSGSSTPEFWINNQYMESSDILTTITDETYPTILGNDKKVLKIDGKPDKKKGLYQKVNVAGNSGDVFVISGWAKAESVFLTQDENVERRFALCVGIERTDGTFQWDFKSFNEDYSQWQYVSGKTIADSDYNSVYYFALYYENENLAYFDGLQLYREEFGQSYAYDGKGNLVSTEDLAKSKSTFEYNSDNELIKLLTPKGGEFTYTYHENNKHNVKTATTAENVTSTFDYDQYGNPERTQVGNTSLFIEASATYSSDGNYVESVKDPSGNTVNYVYNKKRDNVDVVIDSEGNKVFSIYDELDTLVENYAIPANDKVEVFPFRGSTIGSKGTVPTIDEGSYNFDGSNESLYRESGKHVTYDLPLAMSEGTVSMYFKPSATGTRYLFANGGPDFEMLNIYVNSNGYIVVAVRGNDNSWTGVGNSTEKVKVDEWNFMAFNWTTTGTVLSGDLYLNDNKVSMSVDNFKDFTGEDVTIGSYTNETYGLNGEISQFIFSERRFDDAETNSIKQSGRLNYLKDNYVGNKYTYENDRVKSIIHNEVTYNFTYDNFGNVTDVKVGNQSLINHTYEARNGKLSSSTYGNGNTVTHDFDEEDRIISDKYDNIKKYEYEYDGNGNIGRHIDNENDITYRYIYDFADRLGKVVDSEGNTTKYNYDIESNLESIIQKFNGSTHTTSYSYDKDNKPIEVNYDNNKITYGYDTTLGRLTNKSISTNGGTSSIYDVTYSYENGQVTNSTTNRMSSINNNGDTLNYTYDSRGNIKTVTDENNKTIEYFYNYLNELERENNEVLDKTIIYSYDKGGNILSKKEYAYTISDTPETLIKEYNYQYADANWKDKLTSFDGKAITYDLIGNPLTYDNYNFTWQKGRQLGAINGNGKNISFKYNASGIRTEKDVDGIKTTYQLEGDKVVFESNGTDEIYYTYTPGGKLVSMNLKNDGEYFYVRNTQGDIIRLIDGSGNKVVEYTYDSWGKLISIDGTKKDTVGIKNPYRYRGYRYDTENGLYYLQSRYYNPEWGRFISSDAAIGQVGNIQGHNMFQYCFNNPIMLDDPSGYWPKLSTILKGVAIVATAVAVAAIVVATAGTAAPAFALAGGAILGGSAGAAGVAMVAGIVAIGSGAAATKVKAAEATSGKSSRREHTVYKLVDKSTGQTKYVGRSKNPEARRRAHNAPNSKTKGLQFQPIASNLTYYEARGVEQIAMLHYNTKNFLNSVNGISPKNPRRDIYMTAGRQLTHYIGNQISNEILYWTGK